MGKRHCWKCNTRHGKPTGLKCKKVPWDDVADLPSDQAKNSDTHPAAPLLVDGGVQLGLARASDDSSEEKRASSDMEKCLDSMEDLLYKLTENVWPQHKENKDRGRRCRSHSRSSVDTDVDRDVDNHASRHRRRKDFPSKYCYNVENVSQNEEIQVKSFEDIMVATFRTLSCDV